MRLINQNLEQQLTVSEYCTSALILSYFHYFSLIFKTAASIAWFTTERGWGQLCNQEEMRELFIPLPFVEGY